ncbi:MAG: hypothetical protein OEU25_23340, partial [Rhodospirillales bacterium]|nr:hypothetical protein [Rhodospirillales bacterium]
MLGDFIPHADPGLVGTFHRLADIGLAADTAISTHKEPHRRPVFEMLVLVRRQVGDHPALQGLGLPQVGLRPLHLSQ